MVKSKQMMCGTCGVRAVAPDVLPTYATELSHDGRTYRIELADLAALRCSECGTIILDDDAQDRLLDGLRDAAGLLKPAEIRQRRDALKLPQKELAGYLQISPSTLSRWENGTQIQQRCMDVMLRVFFEVPDARQYLGMPSENGERPSSVEVGFIRPRRIL